MKKVDWSQCEVGNGWLLEDFRFNKEDKSIESLSLYGLKKLAKNSVLVIPGIIPDPEIDETNKLPRVEKIQPFAFADLEIFEIFLPQSLKEIGERAFEGCFASKIHFGDNLEVIKAGAFRINRFERLDFPDSLKKIGTDAFIKNRIHNLVMGDNLFEIGERAFFGNPIENIKLGKGLKKIGRRAFSETDAVEKALFNYAISN